jgi:hypothetical protein
MVVVFEGLYCSTCGLQFTECECDERSEKRVPSRKLVNLVNQGKPGKPGKLKLT